MRISDWSSDVCSSDLEPDGFPGRGVGLSGSGRAVEDQVGRGGHPGAGLERHGVLPFLCGDLRGENCRAAWIRNGVRGCRDPGPLLELLAAERAADGRNGTAQDRTRVVSGHTVSGRVDLGTLRHINKHHNTTAYPIP